MTWESDFGADFGANYDSNATIVKQVQHQINALGYTPALVEDGQYGPKTKAGVEWAQKLKGDTVDGIIGDQTLASLGLALDNVKPPTPTPNGGGGKTSKLIPNIATVVASLKQAASEMGHTLNDTLASLMIGQLRGAEGAYPGVNSTLGGTNNYGASQVTKSLQAAKLGLKGWGAYAHKDSDPNQGSYIGWYYIAPSPLEGARHWLIDNWWGKALLNGNPQNPTDYARILYQGRYFAGMHAGDPNHDPDSDAGKQNVADYAAAIKRGMASSAELSAKPNMDPATITVDPTTFPDVTKRGITEALFDKAKSGGIGSAWSYLLPSSWQDLVDSKGVVWFGPAITAAKAVGKGTFIASVAAGVGVLYFWFTGKKTGVRS